MEQEVFKAFISWNPLDWLYKFIKKRTLLSNIKDKNDVWNFEIVWYIKEIRRAKKKWFFITIEDISDNIDIFLSDTYGFNKFDIVIVQWWKKNRIQISKIVKTSRPKLIELAWWSYDEKDSVVSVKKARVGEQQQINIERIKAEISLESEIKEKQVWEKEVISNESLSNKEEDSFESIQEGYGDEPEFEDDSDSWITEVEVKEDNSYDDSIKSLGSEITKNSEEADVEIQDKSDNEKLIVTSENISFSNMKQLMIIIAWNPWNIDIEVLGSLMKVSEKWLNEIKKLLDN